LIPTAEWKQKRFGKRWYQGETLSVAIGQGYVLMTPIQLASMVATVANEGTVYRPFLVKRIVDTDGKSLKEFKPEIIGRTGISADKFRLVKQGLFAVVNEPGGTGGLLLSNGSRPFTHLRVEGAFFDRRLHAIVVNGALSQAEDRFIAFHRLEWQATPALRLAVAEGAAYQSDFVEPLYLVGIIPYPLVGRLLERDNNDRNSDDLVRNNVMWDADVRYIPRPGVEIYGELLLDDLGTDSSETPTRLGYQVGGAWLGRLGGRVVRARGEWTRVWRYVYSVFYDQNFIHEGVPLGYPHGPDSRVIHLDTAIEVHPGVELGAIGERIDHGEDGIGIAWDPDDPAQAGADASAFGGVVERQWRLMGTARYRLPPFLEVNLELGGAWVRNAAHLHDDASGIVGRAILAITK